MHLLSYGYGYYIMSIMVNLPGQATSLRPIVLGYQVCALGEWLIMFLA